MSRYVVDASVAVKWFLPETDSLKARDLVAGGFELLIPSHLIAEVGNVAWKRFQHGELTLDDATAIASGVLAMRLIWRPIDRLVLSALDIACQYRRTVYDSLYLALAVSESAVLITADERLHNALMNTPLAPSISLLAHFNG